METVAWCDKCNNYCEHDECCGCDGTDGNHKYYEPKQKGVNMKPCKDMSDDGQEICCNPDCAVVADFCPLANYPTICRYYEPKEDET